MNGDLWHSKFTIAHELGHLQTMIALQPAFDTPDLDYCYPSMAPCRGDHTLRSHEWQASAAIEGMASWYSVSVWNDVDLVECPNCGQTCVDGPPQDRSICGGAHRFHESSGSALDDCEIGDGYSYNYPSTCAEKIDWTIFHDTGPYSEAVGCCCTQEAT